MEPDFSEKLKQILEQTHIIRQPRQRIDTFYNTEFAYTMISPDGAGGSVLHRGQVLCARPTIITPGGLAESLAGFGEGAEEMARRISGGEFDRMRVLGYQFQNKLENRSENGTGHGSLAERVEEEAEREERENLAIVVAPEEIWPLALLKVIFAIIRKSVPRNVEDLEERGFFLSGGERHKQEIESLFRQAAADREFVPILGKKLNEYNLFEEYEDRFFELVRGPSSG